MVGTGIGDDQAGSSVRTIADAIATRIQEVDATRTVHVDAHGLGALAALSAASALKAANRPIGGRLVLLGPPVDGSGEVLALCLGEFALRGLAMEIPSGEAPLAWSIEAVEASGWRGHLGDEEQQELQLDMRGGAERFASGGSPSPSPL